MRRRPIPACVHVPWFLLALAGVCALHQYDAGWRTWSWEPGAYLPYRFALVALGAWGTSSRWCADRVLRRR